MKAPTKTQLMIAQELKRLGCKQEVTRQDEYLKFSDCRGPFIWVGRRGEIRTGRRLSESLAADWGDLKRDAKKNYKEN